MNTAPPVAAANPRTNPAAGPAPCCAGDVEGPFLARTGVLHLGQLVRGRRGLLPRAAEAHVQHRALRIFGRRAGGIYPAQPPAAPRPGGPTTPSPPTCSPRRGGRTAAARGGRWRAACCGTPNLRSSWRCQRPPFRWSSSSTTACSSSEWAVQQMGGRGLEHRGGDGGGAAAAAAQPGAAAQGSACWEANGRGGAADGAPAPSPPPVPGTCTAPAAPSTPAASTCST